jgi:hypothetical protein
VTAELGGNHDTFSFDTAAGVEIRNDVRLYVNGESGDDSVVIRGSPAVVGATFLVSATLGDGNDSFFGSVGSLTRTTRAARANFLVNGGNGDDGIHVLGGGAGLTMEAACALDVSVRGGANNDFLNVDTQYNVATTSRVKVLLDGGDGDDVGIADFICDNPTPATVVISATVRGGNGDDDLAMSVIGHVATGLLDGGLGIDYVAAENVKTVAGHENP